MSYRADLLTELDRLVAQAEHGSLIDPADYRSQAIKRLVQGAEEYGDASYNRPIEELVDEALEETVDIAGWLALAVLRYKDSDFAAVGGDAVAAALKAYRACEEMRRICARGTKVS